MNRVLPILTAAAFLAMAFPLSTPASSGISSLESDEIDMSYSLLTSEFYKKVNQQTAVDGARDEMFALLRHEGVASPKVAEIRAVSDPATNAKLLEREVSALSATYGAKVPGGSRTLTYAAIAGLLSSVKDKYTTFLTPSEYAELNEGLDGGNFSGVGISIQVDDKTKLLEVNEVIPDGPAEKAGLQAGDVITMIDDKSTKGLTTEQDAKLLRGEKGSVVKLTIERAGAELPIVAVTRDTIHQPSVYSKLLDNGIGYARLTVFGKNTAEELTTALTKLQAEGAKAYVLDLRDNGGGYLESAVQVSSKFIPSGPIVSVESRGGSDTQYDAENTAVAPKPLAVLVNKYTASASEITSGAIQDDGVGELIGEKTYGKGVVQTIDALPDGSAVKITTARYLTPRGRDINLVGIQPDIVSAEPSTARLGDPASDPQLQSAITYLTGKIASTGS
jgi:carboxyl-terminal processing protease